MTPKQLREVAARIRARRPPPHASTTVAEVVRSEAMHALAGALDEQADLEEA